MTNLKQTDKATKDILLHADCWDATGIRHSAGTVVSLPVDAADRLIADGKAKKTQPQTQTNPASVQKKSTARKGRT